MAQKLTSCRSICLDEDNPKALEWLAEEYNQLLEMYVILSSPHVLEKGAQLI